MLSPDERVKAWVKTQVRFHVPMDAAHLHYRDCPQIEVYECEGHEGPLSEATGDIVSDFRVVWGCSHGPERMQCYVHSLWSIADLIEELSDLDNIPRDALHNAFAVDTLMADGFYAAAYPAPGGVKYVPDAS
jgi:hypothetical protein